jgi:hypothetical protein
MDNEMKRLYVSIFFWVIVGFIAGFCFMAMITTNYLESAKIYMENCQGLMINNTFINYSYFSGFN